METLIEQIEQNKNINGGGLAVNITGKHESNRHAIAKIEKVTFGDAAKYLRSKKGGGIEITAKELLDMHFKIKGEPEWHHAGFLPKSYGGGMKKTYFLDKLISKEMFDEWKGRFLEIKEKEDIKKNKESIAFAFLKENAERFERLSSLPEFAVNAYWEMQGKYGWFPSSDKYRLDEYVSGYKFKNEEDFNNYLKLKP